MSKQKKSLPTTGVILYGIGGLSAITEVVFLLLFLPLFGTVNLVALSIGAFFGIILPVLIMPLCYSFINGNTAIATGRYHLAMAVSSLLAAMCYVCLLGVGKASAVLQGFAVFGLTFAYSLGAQTFLYTSIAVGRRFDPVGRALKLRNMFTMLSALAAALIIFWLIDSSRDSIRAIISVSAVINVAAAFITYMTTARAMPSFVRLEPKHKRSLKDSYALFCAPLKNKLARPLIISAFCVCAGAGFAAATVPSCVFSSIYGISKGYKLAIIVAALTLAASGTLSAFIIKCKGRKGGAITCIVTLAVLLCVTALTTVSAALSFLQKTFTFVYAAACGIALGAAFAYENDSKAFVAEITGVSPGRYYCFRNCIAVLGLGVGVALACAVKMISDKCGADNASVAFIAVYACFAVFITAGTLLNYLNLRRERRAEIKKSEES